MFKVVSDIQYSPVCQRQVLKIIILIEGMAHSLLISYIANGALTLFYSVCQNYN